jgi:hypothetical protein
MGSSASTSWTWRDPLPHVTLPNFLVIGAYKAGTTSLHHYLRSHPDVYVPDRKEPSYYAFAGLSEEETRANPVWRLAVRDRAAYEALFDDWTGETAIGEVSPEYLKNPAAVERIAAELPDVRLVAVLRNPVERAFSDYLMYRRDGREPEADFDRALDLQEERRVAGEATGQYLVTGFYGQQLAPYYERFAADRICVVLTEDLAADRSAVMARLFGFLGVDPGHEVADHEEFNRSGVPSSGWVRLAYSARRRLAPVTRVIVPDGVKRRIDGALQDRLERVGLPVGAAERLRDVYREDIELTARLIGRDLSHWSSAR